MTGINLVSLLVALGLFALWIINLATAGGPAWFTWLVFVAACILAFTSLTGLGMGGKRRLDRPAV